MRRRHYLRTGATLFGGALAGCTSTNESSDVESTDRRTTDERRTEAETAKSYTVSMEPMGTVEFERPPERWVALLASYGDMGVALGAGQSLGTQLPYRYASHVYDELPGVEYDEDAVATLNQNGVDKEMFYEMDADVHFMEPNQLKHWYDWDDADVREIEENVGPFFGNFIRRRSDGWHDYPYYSLYGAFEKTAQVFQRQERYSAFAKLHDEILERVKASLPPAEERPRAMLLYPADEPPESFYPYRLYEGGVAKKHWRDLGLRDAFANSDVGHYAGDTSLTVDVETLLEIDPDALLIRGQVERTDEEFHSAVVEHLQDHSVAGKVTAVDDGAVYRGGYLDQGPIIHLFQLERAAQAIYADEFGDDPLFDRQRVADIVAGDH